MNFLSTEIEKDSAKWICNSLYSIMIGMAIAIVVESSDWVQWPSVLSALFLLLVLYYILDWLSFNAIMDGKDKPFHARIFVYVISIVTLGSLLVLSTHLVKSNRPFVDPLNISISKIDSVVDSLSISINPVVSVVDSLSISINPVVSFVDPLSTSAGIFVWFILLYVVVSSVIAYILLSKFNSVYIHVDVALRIVSAVITVVLVANTPLEIETLVAWLVVVVALLIIGKALRYNFYLLPKAEDGIKERRQKQEGGA